MRFPPDQVRLVSSRSFVQIARVVFFRILSQHSCLPFHPFLPPRRVSLLLRFSPKIYHTTKTSNLKEQPTLTPVRNPQHGVNGERSPHGAHADCTRQCCHTWSCTHVVRRSRHGTREYRGRRLDWSGVLIQFKLFSNC